MSSIAYAYEKLGAGVEKLATHPGRVKERLIAAFHHSLFAVPEKALPDEPQKIWREVFETATRIKDEKQGSYQPSIDALSESDAVRMAQMIVTVESMVSVAVHYKD